MKAADLKRYREAWQSGAAVFIGGAPLTPKAIAEAWQYADDHASSGDTRLAEWLLDHGHAPLEATQMIHLADWLRIGRLAREASKPRRKGRKCVDLPKLGMAYAAYPLFLKAAKASGRKPARTVALQSLSAHMRKQHQWAIGDARLGDLLKRNRKQLAAQAGEEFP